MVRQITRIFFRGFLLEALHNPGGKQLGGATWILRRSDGSHRVASFNTNPSVAGYPLGWLSGPEGVEAAITDSSLTAALGGIGDRLIWGILRPLAVIVAILAAGAGPFAAAMALLLVYNAPELALRWRSIRLGLLGREAIRRDLEPIRLSRLARGLADGGCFAIGTVGGFWLHDLVASGRIATAIGLAAAVVPAWIMLKVYRPGTWGIPAIALLFAVGWFILRSVW